MPLLLAPAVEINRPAQFIAVQPQIIASLLATDDAFQVPNAVTSRVVKLGSTALLPLI